MCKVGKYYIYSGDNDPEESVYQVMAISTPAGLMKDVTGDLVIYQRVNKPEKVGPNVFHRSVYDFNRRMVEVSYPRIPLTPANKERGYVNMDGPAFPPTPSFNRSAPTGRVHLVGAPVTRVPPWMREAGTVSIVEGDCGTTRGMPVAGTPNLVKSIVGRYVMNDDNTVVLVTPENMQSFVGKDLMVRSAVFCQQPDAICNICAGTNSVLCLHNKGDEK